MTTPILLVRNQIIARALRLAQASSDMAVIDDQKMIHAGEALACLLRSWQEKKINLWAEEWLSLAMPAVSAVIGSDAKYYRCIRGHTSTTDTAPVTGARHTSYWIEDSLVSGSAVAWANGTSYTTNTEILSDTSYDIIAAFIRDDLTDYQLEVTDQMDFFQVHDVQTPQTPCRLWFDKKTQMIHLDPPPDKTTYVLHCLSIRVLENLLIDGQPPDIVASYQDALVYCLAANIADEVGLPIERCVYLRTTGERFLAQAMSGPCQDRRKPQGIQSMFGRRRR